MIDSTFFIGAIIIAITQSIKYVAPKVTGLVTVGVAMLVGLLVSVLDTSIGLTNISIAQGILIALASVGVHTVAANTSTGTPTPKV
jgi:hypothetical protein